MVEQDPASLDEAGALADAERRPIAPWPRRLARVLFVLVALAAGGFLSLYPWLDGWETNYFARLVPLWINSYARGAVTGLGVVTLSISLVELIRLGKR